MPCMCGDLYCYSCGPAQGNFKCESCGVWTADGGCKDPEACNATVNQMYERYAVELAEEEALAKEYWESVHGKI